MRRVLRVGLTGGIGAGKSTVARRLVERGAVLVDADRLAREVVEPGSEGLAAVVGVFGPGILDPDGTLDRAVLGALVFGDDAARLRLNGILHPRIAALTAERFAAAPDGAVVVHDVPLLVENRLEANYHLVIVVHAPVEERVRRLVADRAMTESQARARIASQADDTARRAAADVWLENAGGVDELRARVDELWDGRIAGFEENLRAGRRAPRPVAVCVAGPDPSWGDTARRLSLRVARAAGKQAVRVDHIGSTAVPGLVAQDVVDLQLVVADLAAADGLSEALTAAGFVRLEDRWQGRLTRGGQGTEFVHGAADPGRPVNLYVRSAQGVAWRETLLFRDWLRCQDGERDAYGAVKVAAAAAVGEHACGEYVVDEYRTGRAAWISAALERARAWSAAAGWSEGEATEATV